jgi:LPXTG-site transpeptidase (sortase) family protein
MNPLFPDEPTPTGGQQDNGYVLPRSHDHIAPLQPGENPAVDLIRSKIDAIYGKEPNAKEEIAEVKETSTPRTKHQQFMYELSTSGKSLAEIQTAWHNYYIHLPDHEKQEVWQEFYAANARAPSAYTKFVRDKVAAEQIAAEQPALPHHQPAAGNTSGVVVSQHQVELPAADRRSFVAIKKQALKKVRLSNNAQEKAKHHFQSLLFGLASGVIVLLIFLFGFFNEVIITPFIQPNNNAHNTPIILSTDGVAPSMDPEIIIPKINVQLPVVYGSTSINEADVQKALEEGVFHYPTTALPGQQGNAAFFGHSSNNIFNKGKYKFAFVLLHELEPGDIFYLTRGGKLYTYKVFKKQVVEPTDTWVLNSIEGHTSTATLITCDPPGTTLHRLVLWADQINPDPNGNVAAAPQTVVTQPAQLAGKGPSAWSRFWHWATPW